MCRCSRLLAVLLALTAGTRLPALEWVTVADPGNPGDPTIQRDGTSGFGAVPYQYEISKFEVTNADYVLFLNAVDAHGANDLALYDPQMANETVGGIEYDPVNLAGQKYSLRPHMGNKPVNQVSYFDALRYVNWLHNGEGSQGTEDGAYTLNGDFIYEATGNLPPPGAAAAMNVSNIRDQVRIVRNPAARYAIPAEHEWYKAAYYEPGASVDSYWTYGTRSDIQPLGAVADVFGNVANPGPNVANFAFSAGALVGAGTAGEASASYYGARDMSGNVWEWTESTAGAPDSRVLRGGSFICPPPGIRSRNRVLQMANVEYNNVGFRVVRLVPEPAGCGLLFGMMTLAAACRYRRCAR